MASPVCPLYSCGGWVKNHRPGSLCGHCRHGAALEHGYWTGEMQRIVSISTVAYDGYALEVALRHMAALELKYVEIAYIRGYMDPFGEEAFTDTRARGLESCLRATGLRCHAFSSHLDLGTKGVVDVFKRRMDFAARLGARIVISNAAAKAGEAAFFENITPIAERASSNGLLIALENPGTGPEDLFDTGQAGAELIRRLGIPGIGLNYDFANLISRTGNRIRPEEDLQPALPYCLHVHIKDVAEDPRSPGWIHTPIGMGIIDYRTVLTGLRSVDIPLSLEIPLRLRRDPTGSPDRLPLPVTLHRITNVLRQSLAYVQAALRD